MDPHHGLVGDGDHEPAEVAVPDDTLALYALSLQPSFTQLNLHHGGGESY